MVLERVSSDAEEYVDESVVSNFREQGLLVTLGVGRDYLRGGVRHFDDRRVELGDADCFPRISWNLYRPRPAGRITHSWPLGVIDCIA